MQLRIYAYKIAHVTYASKFLLFTLAVLFCEVKTMLSI